MRREATEPVLSAVFVDYDNIYLSLKRKSEEASKRFAKDALLWLKEIESGRLVSATNGAFGEAPRRIVMNRCYGNPVPRRNASDNSTDMNSFPFVRHHFLRAGFEIIDCPPLTAQLKNSSDIRMVMDIRDYLTHDTRFEEFVILSGDADFTPVLHRLRAHDRRTVVFANDYTAAPYTAICDGEVRESQLLNLLLDGKLAAPAGATPPALSSSAHIAAVRKEIIGEIVHGVRSSNAPLPLEALAERAMRALGHDKTIGTNWAGAGSFRDLLQQSLPDGFRLTEQPPYLVFEAARPILSEPARSAYDDRLARAAHPPMAATAPLPRPPLGQPFATEALSATQPRAHNSQPYATPALAPLEPYASGAITPSAPAPQASRPVATSAASTQTRASAAAQQMRTAEGATALQQSIARIHEACQAPPLSPPEYRAVFEVMAKEINEAGLQGAQTTANIARRAQEIGVEVRRDDIRFVLEVVSEADPWFEQGASANLFAGRFRNFVVARCRSQGLNLSADELDLIDAWFAAAGPPAQSLQTAASRTAATAADGRVARGAALATAPATADPRGTYWWGQDGGHTAGEARTASRTPAPAASLPAAGLGDYQQSVAGEQPGGDEFPRIVRTRLRG